jgi:hypothetical protein
MRARTHRVPAVTSAAATRASHEARETFPRPTHADATTERGPLYALEAAYGMFGCTGANPGKRPDISVLGRGQYGLTYPRHRRRHPPVCQCRSPLGGHPQVKRVACSFVHRCTGHPRSSCEVARMGQRAPLPLAHLWSSLAIGMLGGLETVVPAQWVARAPGVRQDPVRVLGSFPLPGARGQRRRGAERSGLDRAVCCVRRAAVAVSALPGRSVRTKRGHSTLRFGVIPPELADAEKRRYSCNGVARFTASTRSTSQSRLASS